MRNQDRHPPDRPDLPENPPAWTGRPASRESEGRDSGWVLSRRAVFLWGLGLSVLLVWVFALGVLVGRGIVFQDERFQRLVRQIERWTGGERPAVTIASKPEPVTPIVPKMTFYKSLVGERPPAETALPETHGPNPQRSTAPPASPPPPPDTTTAPKPGTGYVVQVASFAREDQAAALVNTLKKQGYPAYSYLVQVKEQSYFRVRVGPAGDQSGAEAYLDRLTQAGYRGLYITRQTN